MHDALLSGRWLTIDFEAAHDESGRLFPIEVGVACPDGRVASTLIRPPPDWARNATAFDPGLLQCAISSGMNIEAVAVSLRKLLRQSSCILSDAVFVDQPLLNRLYERAIPMETAPRLEGLFETVGELALRRGWSQAEINRQINLIDSERRASHRAGEDALVRAKLLRAMIAP